MAPPRARLHALRGGPERALQRGAEEEESGPARMHAWHCLRSPACGGPERALQRGAEEEESGPARMHAWHCLRSPACGGPERAHKRYVEALSGPFREVRRRKRVRQWGRMHAWHCRYIGLRYIRRGPERAQKRGEEEESGPACMHACMLMHDTACAAWRPCAGPEERCGGRRERGSGAACMHGTA